MHQIPHITVLLAVLFVSFVHAQPSDMNDQFAPMKKRALYLASKLKRDAPCFPVAVAQVIDKSGVARLIDLSNPDKSASEAEGDVLQAAKGISQIPASVSIVTITCKLEPSQSTYSGYMHVHFDNRLGYSSAEVVPYKLDPKGQLLLYSQTPGQPLQLYAKLNEAQKATSAPSKTVD